MILEALFRRSAENPKNPLYEGLDYGVRSDSGVKINHTTALKYSPWWRGINLISRDVAKLPFHVFKRTGEGKDKDMSHPAYPLLRRKANSELTSFVLIQTITANAMACGNGYAFILRDKAATAAATPLELRWLDPLETYPVRENGALLYVAKLNERWAKLLPENVLHIRGLGFDGLCGYPVYQVAADSLGLGIGAQRYGSKFFKNAARPNVVIEYPGNLKDETAKQMREQWAHMCQGEELHGTAVLSGGAKVNPLSINARDAQLLETRAFELIEVANWLGVPAHKLGDRTRTSYASLEQENHSYLVEALDPWLCTWENECNEKLLTERQKEAESHFCEFNRNALVRASFAERMAGYNTALQGGWMSRNEVRSKENMNPLPDGEGDKFYQPLNMQTVGGDTEPPKIQGGTLDALQGIIISIVNGEIPPEAGKVMIQAAYPALEDSDINAMIKAAEEAESPVAVGNVSGGPFGNTPTAPQAQDEDEGDGEGDEAGEESGTREAEHGEYREIAEDVAERMSKRIGIATRKASKKPNEFLGWLDGEFQSHAEVIADAVGPVCRLRGKDPAQVARQFMDAWRERLLTLSERCTIETMPVYVDGALGELEGAMTRELTEQIAGGVAFERKRNESQPIVVNVTTPDVVIHQAPITVNTPEVKPTINVSAPEVHIAPAEVNVTTPDVTVHSAPVTVNTPDIKLPEINLPEQKAPVVNVSVPPQQRINKKVVRDKRGNITAVHEEPA